MNSARGLLLLLLACVPGFVGAHESKPSLLRITETESHTWAVQWKQPVTGGKRLPLVPVINGVALGDPHIETTFGGAAVSRWRSIEPDPANGTIRIDGLEKTITDVLLVVDFQQGRDIQALLTPGDPVIDLNRSGGLAAASAYLALGIEHILSGADHLLFVLGLLLLIRGTVPLLKTITAFTVAHSITLALITLGLIRPNIPLIESLVALSIVFVAVEVVRGWRGRPGSLQRFPWLSAFAFGLLHGAAFGGELLAIGLPGEHLWSALLLFNLGIEAGQILFIAAVLGLYRIFRHSLTHIPEAAKWVPPYAIGSLGALWFFERLDASLHTVKTIEVLF